MTANGTAGQSPVFFSNLIDAIRQGGRLMARLLLGGVLVLAAGIVALATTVLGLLIAMAALIFRFTQNRPSMGSRSGSADTARTQSQPITLEARQTARGWTVE
ncbi:MAG: hypothetical protein AAGK23_09635 [Pseudomonadota bacterium]